MLIKRIPILLVGLTATGTALAFSTIGWDWSYQANPIDELFSLNTTSFPVGNAQDIEDRWIGALDRWTLDGGAGNFSYLHGGQTSLTSWTIDGDNIGQYAASTSGSTLAIAQSWGFGNEMTDCDIEFYGSNGFGTIDWSFDSAGTSIWSEMDFELIATHELGHCLGLGHSADSNAIMFASATSGTSDADRALGADDQQGIQSIYGTAADADLVMSAVYVTEIGDGDGALEPGESVQLTIEVDNVSPTTAIAAYATASTSEPDLLVTVDTATPVLAPDQLGSTVDDYIGIEIEVDSTCTTSRDVFIDIDLFADNFSGASFQTSLPVTCVPVADPVLTLNGPWTAGAAASLTVVDALPNETVYLVRGTTGLGTSTCPPIAGGLCIDVDSPILWRTIVADASGEAVHNFTLPSTAPIGSTVHVQAVIPRGTGGVDSVKSNIAVEVIQ